MKKCPTCEKTFEDNLKFCQTDGTPLVEAEEPEDPYKTTVANASDLPIPPLDMFKTMVADPLPPETPKPEVLDEMAADEPDENIPSEELPEIDEPAVPEPEEEIDLLKTMVATDFPQFESATEPEGIEEPKIETPPSPFESDVVEEIDEKSEEPQVVAPEPPKFSEPEIKPPIFGEVDSKAEPSAIETPAEPVTAPEYEPLTGNPFENADPRDHRPNDLTANSPYGDEKNIPIPSPFESSMPPGYQTPSAPLPPDVGSDKISAGGSPFANDSFQENQQLEAQGWNQPASPNTDWQPQAGGQNLSGVGGSSGQNKTLATGSLICGITSLLSLVCSIIPLVGIICGLVSLGTAIAAIVTGFLGRSRAKNNPAEYGGAGLALGGIITGALTLLGMVAMVAIVFLVYGLAYLG